MPTVARDGGFTFVVHTREHAFEPPHVHVQFGGDEVRIELVGGTFMEEPPAGVRRRILEAFMKQAGAIRRTWEEIHGSIGNDQP